MKAVRYSEYGTPENFRIVDIPRPVPRDNDIVISTKATSINSWDWDMLRGSPWIIRMWGLFRPKYKVLGADVAGVVEEVGKNVKKFKPGDEVFGDLSSFGWGGLAEYTRADEKAFALKSSAMSFEEAAATPQAGLLALQGLEYRSVQPGQKVLLNGAGGGVGTFALQMAKLNGAEVTCVDIDEKFPLLSKLGADHLIDYRKEDFTATGKRYDLILDVCISRRLRDCRRALTPGGLYMIIGGSMKGIILTALMGGKDIKLLPLKPNVGLDKMCELFDTARVRPVIDRIFPLAETADAFRYFGKSKFVGKVVITT